MPRLGASDLHIAAGMPPMVRKCGKIEALKIKPMSAEETQELLMDILSEDDQKVFNENWDLDTCVEIPDVGRFRANLLKQRTGTDGVFRYVPIKIPTPEDLGLNETVTKLSEYHQGLFVIAGPTRSGKSTTAAALLERLNKTTRKHILTIEDPIEFVYTTSTALVNQRQVGTNTESTANALRAALRQDPDIIMVGEMRDLETVQLAISAAETGHLVITTLQTQSAQKTIDRILDSFPPSQAAQVRAMLSESLRGIVCQQLVRRADGNGMALALEILLGTQSLANIIRDGKTFQIPSLLQTGSAQGMKKMENSIAELVKSGVVSEEDAMSAATDPAQLAKLLKMSGTSAGQVNLG